MVPSQVAPFSKENLLWNTGNFKESGVVAWPKWHVTSWISNISASPFCTEEKLGSCPLAFLSSFTLDTASLASDANGARRTQLDFRQTCPWRPLSGHAVPSVLLRCHDCHVLKRQRGGGPETPNLFPAVASAVALSCENSMLDFWVCFYKLFLIRGFEPFGTNVPILAIWVPFPSRVGCGFGFGSKPDANWIFSRFHGIWWKTAGQLYGRPHLPELAFSMWDARGKILQAQLTNDIC